MANVYRNIGAVMKDTGGLWEQLDEQMRRQPSEAAAGVGLWGRIVVAQAGGIWDRFDEETELLRDRRRDVWAEAHDETLILPKEGLLPVWDAVLARRNDTGSLDMDGTLRMMQMDADNVWQRSAEETLVLSRPEASIFAQQLHPRDLTTYRPVRVPGYALKRLTDARGEIYWILKNLRTDAYLRLNAEQVFLWEQMDGQATVQDIAVAYMLEYGKLAIMGLLMLLEQLQQKGFIEPLVNVYGAAEQSIARRRANVLWRRLVRGVMNTELAIGGIDGLITRSYQAVGRFLFLPVVQWAMLAVTLAGGAVFLGTLFGFVPRKVALLGGAGALVGLVTLYALQFVTLLIHEWSHAIATKHYGREVRRGGFLIYMGMPAAFVDTTDIWMEPRRPRIVVSWAGPYSGFFLGGVASLLLLGAPGGFAQGVLYQFAFLTYLTSIMNLNPLLKLDGYYILMDWLEIPRLREKSMAFLVGHLREKLRKREKLTHEEVIFTVFGALAALWTALTLGLLVLTLGGYALSAARTPVGQIVLGGLALVFGYRLLGRWLRARRK